MPSNPRILSFDIETAGVNARKSDLGFVIMFGYKFVGEPTHVLVIDKEDLKHFDDSRLLKKASQLMAEADIIVGHFATFFDRKFLNGRLLIHGLPPIPPVKLRDTCLIARRIANFSSNRLKHLAKILGLKSQKLENDWPLGWFKVMQGDTTYLKRMATYCKGDVEALEELYLRLRPFDENHIRIIEDRTKCGVCGGEVEYRGTCFVGENKYRRYVCRTCKHWGRETRRVNAEQEQR